MKITQSNPNDSDTFWCIYLNLNENDFVRLTDICDVATCYTVKKEDIRLQFLISKLHIIGMIQKEITYSLMKNP